MAVIAFALYFLSILITYAAFVRDYFQGTNAGYKFTKKELFVGFVLIPYVPLINLVLAYALWQDEWDEEPKDMQ